MLGFEPSVHFDGPVDSAVPATAAAQVSAVLREALTNIGRARHRIVGSSTELVWQVPLIA